MSSKIFFNKVVGIPSGPAKYLLGNLLRSNSILSASKIISSSFKLNASACCNFGNFPLSAEEI